jgi:hypothetical protein
MRVCVSVEGAGRGDDRGQSKVERDENEERKNERAREFLNMDIVSNMLQRN